MKPGDLVRHTMKSHSIYGGCVGLIIDTEKATMNGHSRAQIRWFGLTDEFYNMSWIAIYNLVLAGKGNESR
jgi:hypothetical protein